MLSEPEKALIVLLAQAFLDGHNLHSLLELGEAEVKALGRTAGLTEALCSAAMQRLNAKVTRAVQPLSLN